MKTAVENFKPKLRSGRVIPKGSHIIFETEKPYNQITLPMGLADLVLLCSGQFSVREIVEKIYKKQRSVPFKSLLLAIHLFHRGGFFENGDELDLGPHLSSWMEKPGRSWSQSWTIKQSVESRAVRPMGFYILTLLASSLGLLGLQALPESVVQVAHSWVSTTNWLSFIAQIYLISSLMLSLRYAYSAAQLYLLTGKVFNFSICLSPWGVYFQVGEEALDLSENRLFTSMFHVSHILAGWTIIQIGSLFASHEQLKGLILVAVIHSIWELNPFVDSSWRKLVAKLLMPSDRDLVSWRFDSSPLNSVVSQNYRVRELEFARVSAVWGTVWLLLAFAYLYETAIVFGPSTLSEISRDPRQASGSFLGLGLWMLCLYLSVQAFIETIIVSVIQPYWQNLKNWVKSLKVQKAEGWEVEKLSRLLEPLPIFSHLHDRHLTDLLKKCEIATFSEGAAIILEMQPARDLYVLLRGEIEVSRALKAGLKESLGDLSAVSLFGEAALIDESPRQADVFAKTECVVLKVPVQFLRQAAQEAETVRQLNDFRNAILVNQFFASSPVFRSLSTESIDFLIHRGTLEYADQGNVVFSQGDQGDSLYLILRGSINVLVNGVKVKKLGQGSFFGEISLIASIPRTATIETTEPSVFFRITADAFWEVLIQHMDLGVFLETISETRLKEDLNIAPLELKRTGTGSY